MTDRLIFIAAILSSIVWGIHNPTITKVVVEGMVDDVHVVFGKGTATLWANIIRDVDLPRRSRFVEASEDVQTKYRPSDEN
jgi:hypothetical protein